MSDRLFVQDALKNEQSLCDRLAATAAAACCYGCGLFFRIWRCPIDRPRFPFSGAPVGCIRSRRWCRARFGPARSRRTGRSYSPPPRMKPSASPFDSIPASIGRGSSVRLIAPHRDDGSTPIVCLSMAATVGQILPLPVDVNRAGYRPPIRVKRWIRRIPATRDRAATDQKQRHRVRGLSRDAEPWAAPCSGSTSPSPPTATPGRYTSAPSKSLTNRRQVDRRARADPLDGARPGVA